jgi:hypothetical protein
MLSSFTSRFASAMAETVAMPCSVPDALGQAVARHAGPEHLDQAGATAAASVAVAEAADWPRLLPSCEIDNQ